MKTSPSPAPVELPVANIRPSPRNPRKLGFEAASIAELVRSIQSEGLLEPVLVRVVDDTPLAGTFYELISGHRRLKAYAMMKSAHIPARILEADEADATAKLLVGFLQTAAATPMEEADGFRKALELRDRQGAAVFTVAELSRRTGKSESHIHSRTLLCELPDAGQKALLRGEISAGVGQAIAALPEADARAEALKKVLTGNEAGTPFTADGVEALLRAEFMRDLRAAPFDRKNPTLTAAGPCETCPHRTGANPQRFGERKGGAAHVCTRPACYRQKVEATRQITAEHLKAEGVRVLTPEECETEFPATYKGLRYDSPYVDLSAAVSPELLKAEVAANGKVTWAELLEDAPSEVEPVAGFNQEGVVVRLAERKLAIAAIDSGDQHIFRESDRQKTRITKDAVRGQETEDSGQDEPMAPAEDFDYAQAEKLLGDVADYLSKRGWMLSVEAKANPAKFIQPMKAGRAAA